MDPSALGAAQTRTEPVPAPRTPPAQTSHPDPRAVGPARTRTEMVPAPGIPLHRPVTWTFQAGPPERQALYKPEQSRSLPRRSHPVLDETQDRGHPAAPCPGHGSPGTAVPARCAGELQLPACTGARLPLSHLCSRPNLLPARRGRRERGARSVPAPRALPTRPRPGQGLAQPGHLRPPCGGIGPSQRRCPGCGGQGWGGVCLPAACPGHPAAGGPARLERSRLQGAPGRRVRVGNAPAAGRGRGAPRVRFWGGGVRLPAGG